MNLPITIDKHIVHKNTSPIIFMVNGVEPPKLKIIPISDNFEHSITVETIIDEKTYNNFGNIDTVGKGLLSGGSYINNIDTVFESRVDLFYKEKKLYTALTENGKFVFNFLSLEHNFSIKSTPLNTDFEPRIVTNLKPVFDKSNFKFIYYCRYSREYKQNINYKIYTVANGNYGKLQYNMDNAPTTGLSIDENTGIISMNLPIGTYNFTVNCSDSLLEVTKSIPMEIEIIA